MATIDASDFWGAAPPQGGTLWGETHQDHSSGNRAVPAAQPSSSPAVESASHEGDRFLADLQSQLRAVMRPPTGGDSSGGATAHSSHAGVGVGNGANVWGTSPSSMSNMLQHAPPPPPQTLQQIPQLQPVSTPPSMGGFSVVGQSHHHQQQAPTTLLTPPGMAMYLIPGTNQIVLLPAVNHGGSPPQHHTTGGSFHQHSPSMMGPPVHSGGSSTIMAVQFPSIPTATTPNSMVTAHHGSHNQNNNSSSSRRQRNSRGGGQRNSGGSSVGTLQSNGSGVFPSSYQPALVGNGSMSGVDSATGLMCGDAALVPQQNGKHHHSMKQNSTAAGSATYSSNGFSQPRELGNRPNHNTNVHDSLAGKCSFHAYRSSTTTSGGLLGGGASAVRKAPKLLPITATIKDQSLPIFVQMFPSEWIQQAHSIFQEIIRTICGPSMPAVVESMDMRSETSFIALVRTAHVWDLIARLRCRVLMDRHGYWYANDWKAYQEMKDYCDTVRRLPQQQRHCKTDGLPCMPLVVELGRSATTENITAPYTAPFDSLTQGSPGSTPTPSGSDMMTGTSIDGSSPPQFFTSPPSSRTHGSGRRSQRHTGGGGGHQKQNHQHHHHHHPPSQHHMLPPHQQQHQFFFQSTGSADFSSHLFQGVDHHQAGHNNGYVVDQRVGGRGYTAHTFSPSSM
ncbi:Hypothetical protein, putative [Bodo saltans]|uniref:Uncharacterized protein n=1 Tax=Bodo saltans TaxID=75058 RepID=A0A0S4JWG4_BODSA|nr:Hypothetical protein, putative [Bodo saltans]|eukprot:CUG94391.1 Hypothetical protein, putative [Bodo saltans]